MTTHRFFKGDFFNFETIRILGTCRYGGAEVAECLEAVGHIRENDPQSWYEAWTIQADRAKELAVEAQRHGHREAARNAYLRAANYTRASCYMMTGEALGKHQDARMVPILREAVGSFQRALDFFDGAVHILQIPYQHCKDAEATLLPAYLYLPPVSRRLPGPAPIVVNPIGADSIQEEIFHMFPAAGPELGYAILTYEGPGHGLTLQENGLPMRPDWEVVNSRVLDFLESYLKDHQQIEIDLDRIAVAGASLGAYFALRSAKDTRVKACVAIDPLYDLWDFATEHVAPGFFNLWNKGWIPDAIVNGLVNMGTRFSFQMRWEIFTSARFLGCSSPVELLRTMQRFTLRSSSIALGGPDDSVDGYLAGIKCPTLVSGARNSLYFDINSHTMRVFNDLQCGDKELWIADSPGEGGLQAKMGAMALCNQRAYEFLDRNLGIMRTSSNRR